MPTQVERSALTQRRLKAAGRELFTRIGYAQTTTAQVTAAAGLSRGPLYHQFGDLLGLFRAVFAEVESEIAGRVVDAAAGADPDDPLAVMRAGMHAFLDAVSAPDVLRIAVVEAPAALGWQQWHDRATQIGFPLIEGLLAAAVARGAVPAQPLRPVAHLLVGSAIEAALYIASAADRPSARADMESTLDRFIALVGTAPARRTVT